MRLASLLLVTCTRCLRLHVPVRRDAPHPLCSRCAAPDGPAARRRVRALR